VVLKENRKQKYAEAKTTYQAAVKREKFISWKEYCNVTASINPWSQVYKLAARKTHANSIMTTLRKPGGLETSSIQETMKVMLEYNFPKDREEEETQDRKNIRKCEEPINTSEDVEFTREEMTNNSKLQ
jgi:hypothetical protein